MGSICPAWPPLINLFEDALGVLDCVSDGTLPRWAWLDTYLAESPCCQDRCGKKGLHISAAYPFESSSGNGADRITQLRTPYAQANGHATLARFFASWGGWLWGDSS